MISFFMTKETRLLAGFFCFIDQLIFKNSEQNGLNHSHRFLLLI